MVDKEEGIKIPFILRTDVIYEWSPSSRARWEGRGRIEVKFHGEVGRSRCARMGAKKKCWLDDRGCALLWVSIFIGIRSETVSVEATSACDLATKLH